MNLRFSFLAVAALLPATLALVSAEAQRAAPRFSGSSLTAPPRDGWPTNGGDWYNRRYSPLDEISRDNVAELKGVWRARLNGSGLGPQYSGEAQPLFYDGVLFVSTGANDVFAIDVDSGEFVWTYEAKLDPGDLDRLLRLDESRCRARGRQGLHGPARRQAGRSRSTHG